MASNAIDGVTSCDSPVGAGIAGTNQAAGSWWQLDLGQVYFVSSLVIYGRSYGSLGQSNTLNVYVGTNPVSGNNVKCAANVSAERAVTSPQGSDSPGVTVPCATIGRYVTVVQTSNYDLALCEVQVFGTPPTVVNTWREPSAHCGACGVPTRRPRARRGLCSLHPLRIALPGSESGGLRLAAGTTRAAAAPTP